MAITLDADPTSPTFNCYSTIAEADDYFSARLHAEVWTAATDPTKTSALLWASRQLDTMAWKGVRYSGTQNKEFPRKFLSYYENASVPSSASELYDLGFGGYTKVEITETEVPQFLKDATAELSLWLVEGDTTAPSGTENFSRIKVDVIDIQLKATEKASWMNKAVRDLVWRFLANSSPYNVATVRTG